MQAERAAQLSRVIYCRPQTVARQGARSAFTLLEIVIVVSLLGLLAVLAWPTLSRQITGSELPESVSRLRSTLYMARSDAVLEHRRVRVRFPADQQQPLIEWEPDPILYPGMYEPLPKPWALEPVMLGDVQIHEVTIGRPVWTRPMLTTDDAEEIAKEEEKRIADDEEEKRQREEFLRGAKMSDSEEEDDQRSTIVFEADGSTDWTVLIIARVLPEEELEETTEQAWLVLDGRTGLAYVREKVTEDQLADPEFYVDRQKLEPPDTADLDNLSFTIGDELAGADGLSAELSAAPEETDGGLTEAGGTFMSADSSQSEAGDMAPDDEGGGPGPRPGNRGNRGGGPREGNRPAGARPGGGGPQGGGVPGNRPQGGGRRGSSGAGAHNPSPDMDDSDLTPEEKARMREWMDSNR